MSNSFNVDMLIGSTVLFSEYSSSFLNINLDGRRGGNRKRA